MQWIMPSVEGQGVLRWGFISAYSTLIGAVVVYINFVNACYATLPFQGATLIGILLVLLLAIERFDVERESSSKQTAVFFLLIRTAIVWVIVQIDCSFLAPSLYSVIPFAIFFTFSSRTSMLIGLFFWLLAIAQLGMSGSNWYGDPFANMGLVLLTLTLIFIQIIAYIIVNNEKNQQQTKRLLQELKISHQKLQTYAAQVGELAAVEERNRLARDIHDSLGHHLTAVNIQLEKAITFRDRNPSEADLAVHNAKQAAHEALKDVRQSVTTLRETGIPFSLKQALQRLIAGIDSSSLAVAFDLQGNETMYSYPILNTLYRVAQEGLTNVQKHANADKVTLLIEFGSQQAQLILEDNGGGFEHQALPDMLTSTTANFGLQGIQERLELVQGRMELQAVSPHGTRIVVMVPNH
ncbi:MAG: sensor histidine kinase [Chloroflexi bacterium]|nr:sensor histidine kinase [Chloroflexota bacterium]